MQIEKLAAGVRHAPDFSHAFFEASFIAGKIVAHQFAAPGAYEVARRRSIPNLRKRSEYGLKTGT